MAGQKIPWAIEVEFKNKPSEFYAVRKMSADVKDLSLLVDNDGDVSKVTIDRSKVRRVLLMSYKEPEKAQR